MSERTVKAGDTLYKIAQEVYHDGNQWQKIAQANPGIDPNNLQPGQKLQIPD
jgi:5'-nucleotidase